MGQIVVFSKSACPHCVAAKETLNKLEIPFTEIDIEADVRNSMLMSYASKRHTVPQIFFNDEHIGGASELKQLPMESIREKAGLALAEANDPVFLREQVSSDSLDQAVMPLRDVLDPYLSEDRIHLPEYKAVEIWYGQMFGFLCNCYDQMTLKPEPMSLFIPVLSAQMEQVAKKVGADGFGIACMSTAFAADCAYCAAHGADLTMKYGGHSDQKIKQLYDYLRGDLSLEELPFSDKLKAIVLLASKTSTQSITHEDMAYVRSVFGIVGLRHACESIAGMAGIMGFLNRWNDLIGVEIEASIKQTIDSSAFSDVWDWGTHDTEDTENHHIIREIEASTKAPSEEQFTQLAKKVRDDVFTQNQRLINKYLAFDEKQLPGWIAILPNVDTCSSVSALYHASFNAGEMPSDLKHLAAYVMTSGAGYPGMAAEELRIARGVSSWANFEDKLKAAEQLGRGESAASDILNHQEMAALKLAYQAQRFPHVVRGELVMELADAFSPEQIVELVIALSTVGIGQRWVGINTPLNAFANAEAVR